MKMKDMEQDKAIWETPKLQVVFLSKETMGGPVQGNMESWSTWPGTMS